jgi:hypothetical protein
MQFIQHQYRSQNPVLFPKDLIQDYKSWTEIVKFYYQIALGMCLTQNRFLYNHINRLI